jgi:hypothetical protein
VHPPARVADPAQIGVLDHGRHASLILESSGGDMVRYAYGDWNWFALRQTGPLEASAAVLWPTRAALGRMRLRGPFSPTVVAREVDVPIQHAVYLTVDASDVRRLVDRLDQIFHENNAARVYNPAFGLVFVPHSDRYWVFHNSNQVVADWLVQLRCRVEGPAVFSVWERGPRRAAEPEPFSGRGPRGQD